MTFAVRFKLIAGITEGEPLIERGRAPSHFAIHVEIGTEQVAEPPIVSEVPRQLARDQRIVDARAGRSCGGRRPRPPDPLSGTAPCRRGSSTGSTKPGPGYRRREMCRPSTSIAPVPGIDEIETLRKWSAGRKTHGFARLCHRAGESRGGSAKRQHAGCRQLLQTCCSLLISLDIEDPVAGLGSAAVPDLAFYGRIAPKVRRKGRINAPTLGPGRATAACHSRGQRETASHCHVRLPKSVSIPISRRLRNGSRRRCYSQS